MNNLSIEELKLMRDLQENVENIAMVQALDELIAIRELKGEQVPMEEADYTRYSCGCCGFESLHHTTKCPECNYHKIDSEPLFTAPQKPVVTLGHIKISEVVAAVSLEQNRKWNGRVGYMAGWNACIDAAIAGAIVKDGE